MGVYCFNLTIPKSTSQETPERFEVQVHRGVVTRVMVDIPYGALGLVGVKILSGEAQIFPTNAGEWFTWYRTPGDFRLAYKTLGDPPILTVVGYNLDDTYDHTVRVVIEIITEEEAEAMLRLARATEGLFNMFRRLIFKTGE
ncbi:MAG: hypothetical protein J7L14_03800 [Candidatus Diapherotrites archaeon]|nr:hypothetical protein [Candidatus Diapherotrites archaeon]